MTNNPQSKPPLGLVPRMQDNNTKNRAIAILEAMGRYVIDGRAIPSSWFEELEFLYKGR